MCLHCMFNFTKRKTVENPKTEQSFFAETQNACKTVCIPDTDKDYSLLPNLLEQKELRNMYVQEVNKARQNYASFKCNYRTLYYRNELSMSKIPEENFSDFLEGDSLDKIMKARGYTIGRRIGKGGYGQVFQAVHGSRDVAIKSIELFRSSSKKLDKILQKLFVEIAIMERYPHPNIVALMDHFIVGDKAFLVMELAPAGSLETFVNKSGPLDESECYEYFIQMLRGLLYLHSFHIAHRDIKLDNVLLWHPLKVSKIRIAKLTDFGLSLSVYHEREGRIQTGCFAGTRHYMAPEIVRLEVFGEFDVSDHLEFNPFKADIYAMGVSLYEMLTKMTPFNYGRNFKKMYEAQTKLKFFYPVHIEQTLTPQLKDMIIRLMEPDPEIRIDPFGIWLHPWMILWYKHHRIHLHPQSPWYKERDHTTKSLNLIGKSIKSDKCLT